MTKAPRKRRHFKRGARSYPVGTIKVYDTGTTKGSKKLRKIKVREGRFGWEVYSRWLWEKHNGPVPPGKIVRHADGDLLNDDLSNLVLGTVADNLATFILNSPPEANALLPKRIEASSAGLRTYWQLYRLRGWMGTEGNEYWYLVDHAKKRVWNTATPTAWESVEKVVDVPVRLRCVSALLGWPRLQQYEAALCLALSDGPLFVQEARRRAQETHSRHGGAVVKGSSWATIAANLAGLGYIRLQRRGQKPGVLQLTEQGLMARRPGRPDLVVTRSSEARALRNYLKVDETGRPYDVEHENLEELLSRSADDGSTLCAFPGCHKARKDGKVLCSAHGRQRTRKGVAGLRHIKEAPHAGK